MPVETNFSRWRGLFLVAALLIPARCLISEHLQEMDGFLKTCLSYRLFNGSVLVAEQGRIILSKGYGPADREWQIPNSTDTKFKLGSITKSFTAGLILKLAEKKLLRLDDPLSKHLPDYPKDKGDRIHIHHLLCHSTGIPNLARYYPNWFSELWLKEYTTDDFIALFKDLELEFEPGSRFAYSNAGYFLLAAVIERITGKTYGQVLDEMILSGGEDGIRFMEHSGNDLGFKNLLFRVPEKDITIILLSNTSQSRIDLVKSGLLEILFDRRPEIARPLSLALSECETMAQLSSVLKDFRESRKKYIIQHDEIDGLGLQFFHSGSREMGLAVLQFNAEEYPDNVWSHKSLSEAYIAADLTQKVVLSLKRILKLDPNYDWAKIKLSELETRRK